MSKLLFELVVADTNASVQLDQLKAKLKDINKELKSTDDQSGETFNSLVDEAAKTRIEIDKLTERQKQLKREFAASQVPKDSLAGLRLEYSALVEQVTKLSEAERKSSAGQALVKQAADVKGQINSIQESVGNYTGSVGNYKNSILAAFDAMGAIGGPLSDQVAILNVARAGFTISAQTAKQFGEAVKSGMADVQSGIVRIREYLNTLKESGKTQKEAAAGAESIGEAISGAASDGDGIGKAMEGGAKGATLFARAGGVLKAALNGLGIGLIITAVTTLISAFSKFSPLIDFVEQVVSGLSAAFDVLVSRSVLVAKGIGQIFQGNIKEGFSQIGGAVSGMGAAMVEAGFAAADLKKQMQDLNDAQKEFELTTARTEAEIASLQARLRDRTLATRDRLKIADEITKKETADLEARKALIDREIEIEKNRALLTGQISKEQIDQIASGNIQLARQLEDNFQFTEEQTNKFIDLLTKRTQAEGQSYAVLERVEVRRNGILEQAQQRQEALNRKKQEADDKAAKAIDDQLKRIDELEKAVRESAAADILNDFDRQLAEIESKRIEALGKLEKQRKEITGKKTQSDNDKREIELIDQQTEILKASYQKQAEEVGAARIGALEKQASELRAIQFEILQMTANAAEQQASEEADFAAMQFERRAKELKLQADQARNELAKQREEGTIGRREYADGLIDIETDYKSKSLALEQERAGEAVRIATELKNIRIAAAKATLDAELSAIETGSKEQIKALEEQAIKTGISVTEQIAEIERLALAKRKAAFQEYTADVNDANASVTDAQIAGAQAVTDAETEAHESQMERLKEAWEKRKEYINAAIDATAQISAAISAIEEQRVEKQKEASLSALEKEYEAKKAAAAGNTAQLEKIDKDYQKKREAIEKAAARERKEIAIKEALIQGALSVVKALPNLLAAAAAAIAAAAQVAVMRGQEFAHGGTVKFGRFGGKSHAHGGTKGYFDDGTAVEVERDEVFVILNRRASESIKSLSDLNHATGGRRFHAAGGGAMDFTPQYAVPTQGAANQISIQTITVIPEDQMDMLAEKVASKTANATRSAIGDGLDDANRMRERTESLAKSRQA